MNLSFVFLFFYRSTSVELQFFRRSDSGARGRDVLIP